MIKGLKYIFIFSFLFLPVLSFASDCFTFAGWGDSQLNGNWEVDGANTNNGYPVYKHITNSRYVTSINHAGNNYQIMCSIDAPDVFCTGGTRYAYVIGEIDTTIIDTYTWTADQSTVGTIDICEEGGGGSEGTGDFTLNASTTDSQALGGINFGLGIIIVIMSIGVSGYIFNTFNKRKKPWQ